MGDQPLGQGQETLYLEERKNAQKGRRERKWGKKRKMGRNE